MRVILRGAASAIALSAFLSGCKGDADFSDFAPKPVILSGEEYREEITGIDRLVFEERPFQEARRDALAKKLDELAARVKAASDSSFLALESLEIRRLASGTRNLPLDAPRANLRNEWMRLRSNLFDDRSWFARSAADLEPSR